MTLAAPPEGACPAEHFGDTARPPLGPLVTIVQVAEAIGVTSARSEAWSANHASRRRRVS